MGCSDEIDPAAARAVPRRTMLLAAGGALVASAAGTLAGTTPAAVAAPAPADGEHTSLVATALDCAGTGELCLHHCLTEFAKGQTMLAACTQRVAEMVPVCKTLASLAALESEHLKAYAKVCIDVCQACADECRKHEKHAEICKKCADSCVAVIEACRKLA